MIVSVNKSQSEIVRSQVETFISNLNDHLEAYHQNDLPKVKTMKDLRTFAENPKQYFLDQCSVQAKLKNLEGAKPKIYADLFGLSFEPDLQRKPITPANFEYVSFAKGKVTHSPEFEEKIARVGVQEVEDPDQVEAAKLLLEIFSKFTYAATLLTGSDHQQTAGTERIGFSFHNMGNLSLDTISRLAEAMKQKSYEDFTKGLAERFGNPSLGPQT